MKLWYSTSTASTPVHLTLEEAGARYERTEVSWQRDLNVAGLERLNPLGTVPVLELDDGRVLTQSLAIMEHVADAHPGAQLLAAPGTPERAAILGWMCFAAMDLFRNFTPLVQAEAMTAQAAAHPEIRAWAEGRVHDLLAHVERSLTGRTWIAADRFTIADAWLYYAAKLAGWLEVDLARYPELGRYLTRVEARPAARRILELEGLLD